MEALWKDIRYGVRKLANSPTFTIVAALTLALGIGSTTTMFSVVNSVLIQPLPYQNPDRIGLVWGRSTSGGYPQLPLSGPEFAAFRDGSRSVERIAAFRRAAPMSLLGGDEPEQVLGIQVQAELFPLLGVQPFLGRTVLVEEDLPGGNPQVVVLSYGLWQRLGAKPDILDTDLTIDGNLLKVVGVMPAGFQFPPPIRPRGIGAWVPADLWVPLRLDPTALERGDHFLGVITRSKPGVSTEQAQADIDVVTSRLREHYPGSYEEGFHLVPLQEQIVGNVRPALLVLLGAVCLVLLIACSNVANLLLARATTRSREMSLRLALGASSWRVTRQLMTESVLLAGLGGALGLVLASWGTRVLSAIALESVPRLGGIRIDASVVAFALGVSCATGIVFGLVPALEATRLDLRESLKKGGWTSGATLTKRRLGNLLVVSQIALSCVLLIGAGLLIETFLFLGRVDPGFDPGSILRVDLSLSRNKPRENQVAFYRDLVERVTHLPGVQSAGAVSELPLSGKGGSRGFVVEGRAFNPDEGTPQADNRVMVPGYLKTMRISLREGRYFTEADDERVVIIDEVMARSYWGSESAIGKRLRFLPAEHHPWRSIVGVVGHVKHHGLGGESRMQLYVPHAEYPRRNMSLVVRTSVEPTTVISAIRTEVHNLDRNLPMSRVQTMHAVVSNSLTAERFNMVLSAGFAALALIMAVVGIYGVISHSVAQRTREIGVRMALGSRRSDVFALVLRKGLVLALLGVATGIVGSLVLTRTLSHLLYGVTATDPVTFVVVPLLLLGAALVASYVPARKATHIDPVVALRSE